MDSTVVVHSNLDSVEYDGDENKWPPLRNRGVVSHSTGQCEARDKSSTGGYAESSSRVITIFHPSNNSTVRAFFVIWTLATVPADLF
jgi:hypothetical protein